MQVQLSMSCIPALFVRIAFVIGLVPFPQRIFVFIVRIARYDRAQTVCRCVCVCVRARVCVCATRASASKAICSKTYVDGDACMGMPQSCLHHVSTLVRMYMYLCACKQRVWNATVQHILEKDIIIAILCAGLGFHAKHEYQGIVHLHLKCCVRMLKHCVHIFTCM